MSIVNRRLSGALEKVGTMELKQWDSPEGSEFLRLVVAAERDGHSLDDLGRDLGIPNLKYVVAVRRNELR